MDDRSSITQSLVRGVGISGFIVFAVFVIYGTTVFVPTYTTFQFVQSGITLALAYIAFRDQLYRKGIAILILWDIILIGLFHSIHWWIFILTAAYTGMIALGVYYCLKIQRKTFVTNEILRIAVSVVVFGIANSLTIVVLALFNLLWIHNLLSHIPELMYLNLKIGVLLGLLSGISIEVLEKYIIPKIIEKS